MSWNLLFRWTKELLIGGLAAAFWVTAPGAQETENPFTDGIDIRMGGRYFTANCARCHGMDARGNDEGGGPDLTTGTFQHASTDFGLFRVIRNGIDDTPMIGISPRFSEQVVWQIIAHLRSLSVNPENFDLPGDPMGGRQVYAGKGACATCHMANGQGGRLGPDLSTVANRRDPNELRTDLLDPNQEVEPRWWTIKVTREDGSVVQGLRMNEDTFTFRIIDNDENLWSFLKNRIRAYERIETSTMPSYKETLTAREVDDLIAYLFTLRKESE